MGLNCCHHEPKFDGMSPAFRRTLWALILVNGTMFVVEMAAGAIAGSRALQADALDFFGDTVTYALSLYVIGMPLRTRAAAALFKGLSLGAIGAWVLGATIYQIWVLGVPQAHIMGAVGFVALAANVGSALALARYRNGDSNVRSVWLCSRNDAIGNVAVMVAAGGIWLTGTAWPDLIVASIMAGLFFWSAAQIVVQALHERRHPVSVATAAE